MQRKANIKLWMSLHIIQKILNRLSVPAVTVDHLTDADLREPDERANDKREAHLELHSFMKFINTIIMMQCPTLLLLPSSASL